MNIMQVIPFDLGFTTHPLIEDDKQSLKKFINTLSLKVKSTNWEYNQPTSDHCVALYYFDKNLSCYIMEFGIGVFVLNIKGCIDNTYLESLPMNYNDIAFNLYYAKKKTQNLILKGTRSKEDEKHIRYMNQFMENAWSITKQKNRQFSSTSNYKYKGFSYILSIYHIHVKKFSKELLEKNSNLYKSLYLLMEPSIMKNILEINKQNKIKDNIQNIEPKKFEYNILSETSIVAHSWSGIAVVEEYNNYHSLEEIIELEVRIQATWFLYDCIIDNINNTKYSIVDLQKLKNTIDYISMDTDNIISANMSTGDKDIINSIVKSSGLYSIKEKAFMIINNKIAIENAYVQERSHKYTLFTEIILLLLTLNWEKLITKQETDLVDGIQDYIDEVIPKYIYSCVNASFLQRLSQVNNGVLPEKVFLAGMDTDSCVLKIAVDLFENGIIPIVLSNYCASNGGKESHEAGLKCLSRFVGKKYLVSKEIHIINDLNI